MATLIDSDLLTAIATPFDENNEIDFDVLEKLVNRLINLGCNGFVVGGTTGETPTLSHDEKYFCTNILVKLLMAVYLLLLVQEAITRKKRLNLLMKWQNRWH